MRMDGWNLCDRILIVDWDVHHGNGIQRMFEEDPRVLYVSLHRLDLFPFKPEESDCDVVGSGAGAGYSVNIAWPKRGMGDAEYLAGDLIKFSFIRFF